MRKLFLICVMLLWTVSASAQITLTYTFSSGTTWDPTKVNSNFSNIASNALNRAGGTLTGTLNARSIIPTSNVTYSLGSSSFLWSAIYSGSSFLGEVQIWQNTGSVSDPSIQWSSDTDTGIYLYGTGVLGFTANGVLTATIEQSYFTTRGATAAHRFIETDAAANNGYWDIIVAGEQLIIQTMNDAQNSSAPIITVERTGTTVDSIAFGAGTVAKSLALSALTPTTNGTVLYCSDCLKGSTPCTGSSTGSMAKRENGAWNCD